MIPFLSHCKDSFTRILENFKPVYIATPLPPNADIVNSNKTPKQNTPQQKIWFSCAYVNTKDLPVIDDGHKISANDLSLPSPSHTVVVALLIAPYKIILQM